MQAVCSPAVSEIQRSVLCYPRESSLGVDMSLTRLDGSKNVEAGVPLASPGSAARERVARRVVAAKLSPDIEGVHHGAQRRIGPVFLFVHLLHNNSMGWASFYAIRHGLLGPVHRLKFENLSDRTPLYLR